MISNPKIVVITGKAILAGLFLPIITTAVHSAQNFGPQFGLKDYGARKLSLVY